ncbi:hypothetical protein CLIB1444_05S06326 [[Candida] jaroonii]|uniref:Uncharacterized protein n=1 Tax=[Candida] jaroonii TaxID=467808 RepID=A0ACA9Y8Z6_9ASCO|nr:hypothetical protein CLIB1444_05S06326 [[Candida] jaroonii]
MSRSGIKALTLLAVGSLSWYAGMKFWQPLIIEQLKKDGHLRDDIEVPEPSNVPETWDDVKESVRTFLHPQLSDPNSKIQKDIIEAKARGEQLKNSKDE